MKRIEIPLVENNTEVFSNKSIFDTVSFMTIYYKYENNISLTRDDLIYIYNIYNIRRDIPDMYLYIIDRILENRNKFTDIAMIFNCHIDEITDNIDELNRNPSKYVVFLGDLIINNYTSYRKLKYISGDCILGCFLEKSDNNLFPSLVSIRGNALFCHLVDGKNLKALKTIGGEAQFINLSNGKYLNNLEIIGGNAYFTALKDARGLDKLKIIGNIAYFNKLLISNGLDRLSSIGSMADFTCLTEATHLTNLTYIGGDAIFTSLKDATPLENLYVKGDIKFNSNNEKEFERIKRRLKTKK